MNEATTALVKAAEDMAKAINHDNNANGGLISRDTIRKADELRLAIYNMQREITKEETKP